MPQHGNVTREGREKSNVLECVFASLYAGLRFRIAIQFPYNHFGVRFRLCELSFRLSL